MGQIRTGGCGSGAARARGVVIAGIVLLASGRTARAQFFWYEIQERTISRSSTGNPTVTQSAPDFAPWVASMPGTSQNSTLGGTSIQFSASTSANAPPLPSDPNATNHASASSNLDVQFELIHPFNYSLTGTGGMATGGPAGANSRVRLVNDAQADVFSFSTPAPGTFPINFSGILPVGHYWLSVSASSNGSNSLDGGPGNALANLNFTFSLTPEPASVALLVAGLSIVRRRPALHS